ncbi:nucleoporin complex subunit 54-domain-containing protein [Coniochaeta sp. 2T2.1]|nr:nucleoporin complex subunit 54-domain-containing protein [Coniochaeta sp. 2T2.1]
MSLFGSSLSKPAGQSIFGGNQSTTSAFGQSTAQQTNQQQQQQPQQQSQFGQQPQQNMNSFTQSQQQPQLGSSLWQPGSMSSHQKSIPDQMQLIAEKWHPAHPSCAFKTYFYNKVDESRIPFYQPGPQDDPKEWEEALSRKPAPGFMPVLCSGFQGMAERLKVQRRAAGEFNARLHEINASLDAILSRHDLETSVRALNARRKHAALRNRCLALAARVQVLRNRGYALSTDEDELRTKLMEMERGMQDPALSARMEELWSRLIVLRGYADSLRIEINKRGMSEDGGLGEEVEAKAKKILEDYEKQIQHLKKEVDQIKRDFADYEKEHNPTPAPR